MELDDVFLKIDDSKEDIISFFKSIISIPSIGPDNGGNGEHDVAVKLMEYVKGFQHVDLVELPQDGCLRSSVIVRKEGKKKGTVWIISHIDTVGIGKPEEWEHPPFEVFVDGDRIYGRGAEDNGQGMAAGLFAALPFKDAELNGKSLGIAMVADEETGSVYGVRHLLENSDLFTKDDFIIVPDWGSPEGKLIDISEKHIVWVKVTVKGKQTHGSTPQKGLNAFRVSTFFLSDLLTKLSEKFSAANDLFRPSVSTFEPTKKEIGSDNVNIIPGTDVFYIDCRILPQYDPEDVVDFMRNVAKEHSEKTGASISVDLIQCTASGPSSSTGTPEFDELCKAIKAVTGKEAKGAGIGGGTCANFFRLKGLNAYTWSSEGGTLHKPNEYVLISNVITDAKVFAKLFYNLCLK